MSRHRALILALTLFSACDSVDDSSLRQQLGVQLEGADLSIVEAIAAAQAERPNAVVLEADFDREHQQWIYDVGMVEDGVEWELHVSAADGSILRSRSDALDADDAAEAEAAATLVLASPGWPAIIDAAQVETGATAFEVEADGDDAVLEVELLSDAGIHEVELDASGTVVKSEMSDDDSWEAEEESEDDDDDDGDDDDGEDDDDGKGGDDGETEDGDDDGVTEDGDDDGATDDGDEGETEDGDEGETDDGDEGDEGETEGD